MSTSTKLSFGIVIGLMFAGILALFTILTGDTQRTIGSIQDGQAYNSTTTEAWTPTANAVKLIKTGSGTLGSVIITNSTAGVIDLYDATTTVNGAIYGTTTLAKIGASLAAGTYTFDVVYHQGLLIDVKGSNISSSTITYR